jgi:hypothetical protein
MVSGNKNGKKPKQDAFQYVPCTVEPGMFRGEFLVHANAIDPNDPSERISVQVLVDDWLVRNVSGTPQRHKPVPGYLRVGVSHLEEGYAIVVLPQLGIPVGESMVVHADSLVSLT